MSEYVHNIYACARVFEKKNELSHPRDEWGAGQMSWVAGQMSWVAGQMSWVAGEKNIYNQKIGMATSRVRRKKNELSQVHAIYMR